MFFQIAVGVLVGNLATLLVYKVVEAYPPIIGRIVRIMVGLLLLAATGVELFLIYMGFENWQNWHYWIAWLVCIPFFAGLAWLLKKLGMVSE